MSLYVGINNKPKAITSLLVGKNNAVKETSSAYTGGVNSKKQIFESFNLDKELSKVNPVDALTSGKIKKKDIGKTVYLSNSQTACQEWLIADIDHLEVDNTRATNTVSLVSKYTISDTAVIIDLSNYPTNFTYMYYSSDLRKWLTTTFYNGFSSNVLGGMVKIKIYNDYWYWRYGVDNSSSHNHILEDYVICPTPGELDARSEVNNYSEWGGRLGNPYAIFNNSNHWGTCNLIKNLKKADGGSVWNSGMLYTREITYSDGSYYSYALYSDGVRKSEWMAGDTKKGSVLAIIRFGKK